MGNNNRMRTLKFDISLNDIEEFPTKKMIDIGYRFLVDCNIENIANNEREIIFLIDGNIGSLFGIPIRLEIKK